MVIFVLNRKALRIGRRAVTVIGPITEEVVKTGLAVIFQSPLPYAHAAFGLIEAAYDAVSGSRVALLAAALSISGHTLFGLLTQLVATQSGSIPMGVLISIFTHALWNRVILTETHRVP